MTTDFATCRWHPDRRAGVICQRCDSPICPSCMHQASVGFHCPNCVAEHRPKVVSGQAAFGGGFQPTLTYVLMGVNILFFFLGSTRTGREMLIDFSATGNTALVDLPAGTITDASSQYYRLLTAGFLHWNFLHIALNMFALYNLGPAVERTLGRLRFGLVYALALLTGSLGAVLVSPDSLSAGASGALYGLFGALVIVYRRNGLDIMRSGLGLSIALNFFITLSIPNISLGGHLGGFVGGLAGAWVAVQGAQALRSPKAALGVLVALVPLVFVVGVVAMNVGDPTTIRIR